MIIAVSGTPCTGKTMVAKLLAEKLGYRYVDLNRVAEEKGFYSGFDERRGVRIVNTDLVGKEIRKMEGDIVLDSHYAHEMDNDLTVILRTNPKELRERMRKKGWPTPKIEENVQAEIMEICMTEALALGRKIIEIDTTREGPEGIVEEIITSLHKKGHKQPGHL
jgi:adenylate kinase